jgi:adenylate kinase family enzyme
MTGSILLVAGPPGAGKSTVARRLADDAERSVHLHTDDFYAWNVQGYDEPWTIESHHQNTVIFGVAAAAADGFAAGGYEVLVDGVLGVWGLDPWRALRRPVSYALLLPDAEVARQRAADRGEHALKDLDVVKTMHDAFVAHLDGWEHHVIDSTGLTPEQTAAEVQRRAAAGDLRLR